jgi:hypothetical protein
MEEKKRNDLVCEPMLTNWVQNEMGKIRKTIKVDNNVFPFFH